MNIYKIFKFIEEKTGKPVPVRYKIIYAPNTLTPEELNFKGSLELIGTKITSLPKGLKVEGNLNLLNCHNLTSLPDGLYVGRDLIIHGCFNLTYIPDNLTVKGDLRMSYTLFSELPKGLIVGDSLYIYGCFNLKTLPDDLTIGGVIYMDENKVKYFKHKYPQYRIKR